jgi:hypothetical protein
LGDNGLLTLLNNKETCSKPNQDHNNRHQAKQTTGLLEIRVETTTATAGWLIATSTVLTQKFVQFAIEFAPKFIQIGGAIGRRGTRAFAIVSRGRLRALWRWCRTVVLRISVIASAPTAIVQIEHTR